MKTTTQKGNQMRKTNVIETIQISEECVSTLYDKKSDQVYILATTIEGWINMYPEDFRKPETIKAYSSLVEKPMYLDAYSIANLTVDLIKLRYSHQGSIVVEAAYSYLMNAIINISIRMSHMDSEDNLISRDQEKVLKRIILLKQHELTSICELIPGQILNRIDTLIREKFLVRMRKQIPDEQFLAVIDFVTQLKPDSISYMEGREKAPLWIIQSEKNKKT